MLNPPVNGKTRGLFKALSVFQVLFKASLTVEAFLRQSCIYFSTFQACANAEMAIKNSVSNNFCLCLSMVLSFLIATYMV